MTAFGQLTENLRQIHSLYVELVELGEQKKEHIVHNRLNELTQTVARESKALKRLGDMEKERVQAMAALQQELGLKPDPGLTLDDTLKMIMKSADKQQLMELRDAIAAEAKKLQSLNETNQLLVKQGLDFVSLSLDLLTTGPEDDMLYQAPAQQTASSAHRKRLFDTKA
ncbi:flagellar protein FlgN [Cohnella caldifontis]|uniref:flagellar protein FlgN n=1 Tax=Cohnella caldifontis TaxID=3027471 RepID=UPI0023EC0976|nr:flagellar protein FlgN [Cohnella sp. YIM B05605]